VIQERAELEAAEATPEALAAGREILETLMAHLGFEGVSGVRIGKIIDLTIDGAGLSEEAARAQVDDMCRKLLSNPIIEDYTFEITEG